MQLDQGYQYQNNVDVGDMCAGIGFILVLPFPYKEANKSSNFKVKPYVLTFENQETHIGELMNDFRVAADRMQKFSLQFTLRSGQILTKQWSVRALANSLGRDNINGLVLFVTVAQKIEESDIFYDKNKTEQYFDECAVTEYYEKQKQFGTKLINVMVQIPKKGGEIEVMSLKVNTDIKGQELIKIILEEMKKNFGVNLHFADKLEIKELKIKETDKPLDLKMQIYLQKIYNWSRIVLHLKKNTQLNRLPSFNCNHTLIIYKLGQKDPLKFQFAKIADLTFKQLYESKLELNQSKHRKQLSYGLKIMDMIVGPQEKLLKAAPYFSFQTKNPYSIVGKVINQKMVFYQIIPKILKANEQFKIDDHIKIPPQSAQRRIQIRKLTIERTKAIKKDYFKDIDKLEPILIYTSELCYYEDHKNKKIAKIYESLNRYLRENPLLSLDQKAFKSQWRYRYSCALLTHLNKAQKYSGKAYRGISYDPKLQKNSIVTFKQFGSSSLVKDVAVRFAADSNSRVKQLFELKIAQAYKIKQFSEYTEEEQVLLTPFTEFQVTQIKNQNVSLFNSATKKNQTVNFRVYVMQQISKQEKLPPVKANFIVWIDPEHKESAKIFSSIQLPNESTLFIQLFSTQQLKKWLKKNEFLFDDPTANLIFITNMNRKEGNNWNQIAGIQGLREIRKFGLTIPVFFYIGDINKTNQKLVKNSVYDQNVDAGQSPLQVKNYISMHISNDF